MDFTLSLFLEKIPGAVEMSVAVDGIPQRCIVIPIDNRVVYTSKTGMHFLHVDLREYERIKGTETHCVSYIYPEPSQKERSPEGRFGKCLARQDKEMNKDKTNRSTFTGYGTICLDDIDADAVYVNPYTGKKYVRFAAFLRKELDRGGNTHDIVINWKYGAEGGTRESLKNGFDAPLAVIGQMVDRDCMGDGENDKPKEKSVGGYRF